MTKKRETVFIGLILLTATFLRFYQIYEVAPFLGDQGRDLIEVRKSLLIGQIPLKGPLTNFGVHTGAVYYYLLIPPLLLTNFHPIGPILFITFLGVITSLLIYKSSRVFFRPFISFLAAMLYASSPLIIQRTRGFWNPIPIPFFILLIIFSFLQIQEKRKLAWFAFLGLSLGIATQLYLPAIFLFLPTFGWWFYFLFKKKNRSAFLKWSLWGLAFLFLSYFSFFLFQFQNQFVDVRNLLLLLLEKMPTIGQPKTASSFPNLFFSFLGQQFKPLTSSHSLLLGIALGLVIIILPLFYPKKRLVFWHAFLSLWFLGGILVLTFSFNIVYPHHASFIWPLPFLLWASFLNFLSKLISEKGIFALGVFFILLNLKAYYQTPLIIGDLAQAEITSDLINTKAQEKPFLLVLVSNQSASDGHLRYFLDLKGAKIKSIGNRSVNQLFLICEQPSCLMIENIKNSEILDSECLPACPPPEERKKINLKNWVLKWQKNLFNGRIYLFENSNSQLLLPPLKSLKSDSF